MTNLYTTFNIIKQQGSPTEAITIYGERVTRQDKLFVQNFQMGGTVFNGFIDVVPYYDHFIYEVKDSIKTRGLPQFMCTCGSAGVIIGIDAQVADMTPDGLKIACLFRSVMINEETGEPIGRHADGSKG